MKISIAVTLGIVAIIAVAVITSLGNSSDQSNQNKIRVAFFPRQSCSAHSWIRKWNF